MLKRWIVKELSRSRPSEWQKLARNASQDAAKQKLDKYQELSKLEKRPLYLDAQATTPIDPRVLDAMLPYMTNMYGNPHSRTHAFGWESEKAVENAREVIFSLEKKIFLKPFLIFEI